MDICAELRSHWPSQDDPELDDEDKCCLLLGQRAAAEIERLRTALVDLDFAFSFHPSCQKNVIARCGCIVCAKERMREL